MINLPMKQNDNAPDRLSIPGALRQIVKAIQNMDGKCYNSTYYPHNDITNLLKAYSIHKTQLDPGDRAKCNYCESKIEHAATLQVEHFRPKAKIESGENDHIELPGYYWLGLEWTNLLLACPKCNGKDAKGNKFPIRGVRANAHNPVEIINQNYTLNRNQCFANSNPLLLEIPILINPEIDNPEDYLTFNELGYMMGHGPDADRGETSKNIYKLNRDELLACRQDVWNNFKNAINVEIGGHQAGFLDLEGLKFRFRSISNEIIKRKLPSEEYTLWGRYINNNLNNFLSELDDNYREIFYEIYIESLNQIP